jgi:penicillin-binding protein 2
MEGGAPNKKIRGRAGWLCIVMSVLFLVLSLRIFIYQTFQYDKFRQKVIDQITQETAVKADRGNIYDTNGVVIATNVTTYR